MMMMKFFPPTQIDHILENVSQQNTSIRFDDLLGDNNQIGMSNNNFDFDQLETHKIFHLSQIKEVCIDYRLRFLDLKYFKGNVPKEGIEKISQLEKEHQTVIDGFKIMAPSVLFRLKKQMIPYYLSPWVMTTSTSFINGVAICLFLEKYGHGPSRTFGTF